MIMTKDAWLTEKKRPILNMELYFRGELSVGACG